MNNITIGDLKKLIGSVNIIDIRNRNIYMMGNIPTSINIEYINLLMEPGKYLNKDTRYYIYCMNGYNSSNLCNNLRKKGYDVVNIVGGYNNYL